MNSHSELDSDGYENIFSDSEFDSYSDSSIYSCSSDSETERTSCSEIENDSLDLDKDIIGSDVYLKILSCFIRNELSATACKDVLQTFQKLTPESQVWNQISYDKIWSIVDNVTKQIHYCPDCSRIFPEDDVDCVECPCGGLRYIGTAEEQRKANRQPCKKFVFLDPKKYIKDLLELPGKVLLECFSSIE
ncbi:unnamed protein product [Owenia fusiformis]|uniref:Uncharacterized protein n=2 Tax=Owenia fusiformis TaxID=6347 RepID=A0A8S4NWV8_OWEFU|nr:unnamed protein product [Owenia fusiformis]